MKKIKTSNSKRQKVFLAFVGIMYIFFLTSKSYMYDSGDFLYTPLNTVQSKNNYEVIINRWLYSPKQNLMEVQLQIENKNFNGEYNYEWGILTRPLGSAKATLMLQEDNYYVVHLSGIKDNFREISFQMSLNDTVLKLYTNKNAVERTENIQLKTYEEYQIDQLNSLLQINQKEIEANEEKISSNKLQINEYNAQITKLDQSKKYKTMKEIENTEKEISIYQSKIESLVIDNNTYQEDIEELNLKQDKIKQQLNDLRGG